jgi:coenzyme F420-reducing hydrogenase gamma subunit
MNKMFRPVIKVFRPSYLTHLFSGSYIFICPQAVLLIPYFANPAAAVGKKMVKEKKRQVDKGAYCMVPGTCNCHCLMIAP